MQNYVTINTKESKQILILDILASENQRIQPNFIIGYFSRREPKNPTSFDKCLLHRLLSLKIKVGNYKLSN